MSYTELKVDSAQSFLNQFMNDETPTNQNTPSQESNPIQNFLKENDPTNPSNADKANDGTQEGNKNVDVQAELNKADEAAKKLEEEKEAILIKDVTKLSERFKEDEVLIPYEDGSLPTTQEELIDAIKQSIPFKVNKEIETRWTEKLESLPSSLQLIHEYAELGIQTAEQLAPFVNKVSQAEAISQLDVTNEVDQEQIVYTQLRNSGLTDVLARQQIESLKETKKLEAAATELYPALKKTYSDIVQQEMLEKKQEAEWIQNNLQTNAVNVQYFLEKDTSYLPFKLDNRADKNYKASIYELAAIEAERTQDGTPVFGWQKHLESLQNGTEEQYKEFMEAMAFLADRKKYKESLGRGVANTTNVSNFKKIAMTDGKASNQQISDEPQIQTGLKKKSTAAWSVGK